MATVHYDEAVAETDPVCKRFVADHPFIEMIASGELTKEVYAAYLRETYFLVGQTPYFLSSAAAHSKEGWLQDWFLDLAIDERHHDRLCVHDVRNLGLDHTEYLGGRPGPGASTMITQNHYLASMDDPAGIVGFAAATEGLGANLAPKAASAMAQYEFAQNAVSFLKVHSTEDQEHIETVRRAFERCAADPARYELMVGTWKYTLRAYGALFTDAMERAT
jgi:pyrroloquinoline quinone (PQQ) biosynthesis protein C